MEKLYGFSCGIRALARLRLGCDYQFILTNINRQTHCDPKAWQTDFLIYSLMNLIIYMTLASAILNRAYSSRVPKIRNLALVKKDSSDGWSIPPPPSLSASCPIIQWPVRTLITLDKRTRNIYFLNPFRAGGPGFAGRL